LYLLTLSFLPDPYFHLFVPTFQYLTAFHPLPLHDALPISFRMQGIMDGATVLDCPVEPRNDNRVDLDVGDPWRTYETGGFTVRVDRKSTRLNSSHVSISYAVFGWKHKTDQA